jgi:tricorn protease
LLAGKADKPVELTLRRDGAEPRRVVVVPTDDEYQLRYVSWVADRRAYVAEKSAGRLGYLHLPDQSARGWAEFHRDLSAQTAKEGMVVDTRDNGGGNTSELVLQKLLRSVIGWSVVRDRQPRTYPQQAPRGPIVSVCDEHAGSDGDIINQALKEYGIPVVGVRTWGGTVGIDSRFRLVDGTTVTQPKYAHWFRSVGFGLENRGVEPTVEVQRTPQDMAAGRDPQLDEAIRILLERLEAEPAATPPTGPWSARG